MFYYSSTKQMNSFIIGSVLLQDEMKASSSVAIDINVLEQQRLQQQVSFFLI